MAIRDEFHNLTARCAQDAKNAKDSSGSGPGETIKKAFHRACEPEKTINGVLDGLAVQFLNQPQATDNRLQR